MAYTWSKDLETGNATIDGQHKQLFTAINNLLDACGRGQGRNEIEKTLNFLSDYITRHFADEERLQAMSKYPDMVNHKRYHEGFKQVVAGIQQEFKSDGASVALVAKVNAKIGDWLISHIKREDVKVAAHLRANGI